MEKSYAKSLKTWSKKWGDLIEKGKRSSFVISEHGKWCNTVCSLSPYQYSNLQRLERHGVSFTSLYQSVGDILKISFHSRMSPTHQQKRLLTVRDWLLKQICFYLMQDPNMEQPKRHGKAFSRKPSVLAICTWTWEINSAMMLCKTFACGRKTIITKWVKRCDASLSPLRFSVHSLTIIIKFL